MTLPFDYSRCQGIGSEEKGWREDCSNCLRRTSPGRPEWQSYISPPPSVPFGCNFRIDPKDWA